MPAIRAILLDVMGTLVHEPFYADIPRFLGMSLEELRRLKDPESFVEFERGLISEAEYVDRFFLDRRPLDVEGLKQAMRESYRYLEGVEGILGELLASGRPMYALSNYSPWYSIIEEKLALSRYLDWRFVSCRTGHRKPEKDAYLFPTRELAVQPEECLFVDDRPPNCRAAADLGMHAIHFKSAADLRAALDEHGLLSR